MSATRKLSGEELEYIASARNKAFLLYEGALVPHRSCGIALAETFGLPHAAYQALRRGGITGEGRCGAIVAGELILGQILGDQDPTGQVTEALRGAIEWYQGVVRFRIQIDDSASTVCNDLTRPLGVFHGLERKAFCTNLAAQVAEMTAEAMVRFGSEKQRPTIEPVGGGST